jgi:hypothetical protein
VNIEEELVSSLEEIDRLKRKNKNKKSNCRNIKRRIMISMKQKKSYHSKDSTRRGKEDRRSGEKSTERRGRKLRETRG